MPLTLHIAQGNMRVDELKKVIFSIFETIDQEVNHFNPNSVISKFNKAQAFETFTITPLILDLLKEAKTLYLSSHARFDPTYGSFDNLEFNDKIFFKTEQKLKLDLNALSKGKALDLISTKLKSLGIKDFILNWAGEICVANTKATSKIQIQGCQHLIEVKNRSIATSSAYTQARKGQSHFIDTTRLKPIDIKDVKYKSITVVSNSCSFCDALATCAFLFKDTNDLYAWITRIKKKTPCRFYLVQNDKTLVVK